MLTVRVTSVIVFSIAFIVALYAQGICHSPICFALVSLVSSVVVSVMWMKGKRIESRRLRVPFAIGIGIATFAAISCIAMMVLLNVLGS